MDIFSGEPIIYRTEGDGFVLYSVGPNERDDGGHSVYDDNEAEECHGWDDLVIRVPRKSISH